ncbi:MAG: hypothetical protein ACE15C_03380 [Phycisphaerae bacterium]
MSSRRRWRKFFLLAAAVVAAGVAAIAYVSCSTPEGWRSADTPVQPRDLMEGTWDGEWASDGKVLHGRMSAVIERLPDSTYRASFDSETPFGFNDKSVCIFRISQRGPTWHFEGEENLGLLKGGVYRYKGTVGPDGFQCRYESGFDNGVYRMTRRTATAPATRLASAHGA